MKFLLEEEDSVEVLKTYFRPTPDGHVGRYLADAIAVRQRQQPSEDAASSERAVRSLLQRDEEEQDFLEVYCGIIVRHLFLMQKAITFIRELIADKVNFRNNAGHVWRPIEDLLARAAAISRFFDASTQRKPTKEDRERREYRRNLLRLSLGVQEEKQFAENVRGARNIVEHFEEYLDAKLHDAVERKVQIFDLVSLTAGEAEAEMKTKLLLRWFDFEKEVIHIMDDTVRLRDLDRLTITGELILNQAIMLRNRYGMVTRLAIPDPG